MTLPPVDLIVSTSGAGWRARVTLDGLDISARCTEVYFAGERPVAVVFAALDGQGQPIVHEGEPVYILTTGAIVVSGLPDLASMEAREARIEQSGAMCRLVGEP